MERLAFSVKEAAEALGVSARTIAREVQRGRLRTARVGKRVLIPAQVLESYVGCVANQAATEPEHADATHN